MKFTTNWIWLCVVLFVNPVLSESGKEFADQIVLPISLKLLPALAIPPPAGPIIMASLGIIQICSGLLDDKKPDNKLNQTVIDNLATKVDLMEARTAIMNEFQTLDNHLLQETAKIIRELTMAIETTGFSEKMRESFDYLQRTFVDKIKIVIDNKITGKQKQHILEDMLNYSSDYRSKLRSLIDQFIKSNANEQLILLKPAKLFFDFVLEKEIFLADNHDDCSLDSLHNRIYKSFMYILKVLTEGYTMAVSAHFVVYQEDSQNGTNPEAEEIKTNALSLINDYKNDAIALIETTKSALDQASREIRNCGQFELQEGKTFERISIGFVLPNISYFEYIDVFYYECKPGNEFIDFTKYDVGKCDNYEETIPFGSELIIPVELKKPTPDKTPYSYMKVVKPDNIEELFGHNRSENAIIRSYKAHPQCHTTFCPVYKKNFYAISTERVSAEPGNVITGARFRVRNRVIFVDIQQGKFSDLLSVDPETVYWTESPETNKIRFLGAKLHKIELGDFKLKDNSVLTSIQLTNTVRRKDLIRVVLDGKTPPYMNNTESMRMKYTNADLEINELILNNADNPEMVRPKIGLSKNIISKPPVAGKRYFVSFQSTDFKKDLGQSTVPLIDIREVVSNPPTPLNGFGLYHEAVEGSGGLIAMKLITPVMTDFLDTIKQNLV